MILLMLIGNADHGSKKRVLDAFSKSEANLGFSPDLYLIHFPGAAKLDPKDKRNKAQRHNAWSAMAELYDTGRVNSIGVSNFTKSHLEQLLVEYHSDIPVVNQVLIKKNRITYLPTTQIPMCFNTIFFIL